MHGSLQLPEAMSTDECARIIALEGSYWWHRALHRFLERRFEGRLPAGGRLLDLGCGTGRLLKRLADRLGAEGMGVDRHPVMAKEARRHGLRVELTDMLHFVGSTKGTYHAILLVDSFYFLSDTEQTALLKSAFALLEPGGILALHLPGGRHLRREHDATVGIRERYDREKVQKLLAEAQLGSPELFIRPRIFCLSAVIFARKLWQMAFPSEAPRSDLQPLPRPLNAFLLRLQCLEDKLPWLPGGSSLYVELRKPSV